MPRKAAIDGARQYAQQPGLDFLFSKGRISQEQYDAGQHYGWAFRMTVANFSPATATLYPAPKGWITLQPQERHFLASRILEVFRQRISFQPQMVAACDAVCGEEKTPREAVRGGERDALRLEAHLFVALDLMARKAPMREAA